MPMRALSARDVLVALSLGAALYAALLAVDPPKPRAAPATCPAAPSRIWDMKWIVASLPEVSR